MIITKLKEQLTAEFDRTGKFVYVPHTSPNKVYQYRLNLETGRLTPLKQPWVVGPDEDHQYHQPRHIAFHPTLDMAYTSNERGGGISGYKLNTRNGMLTLSQTLSSLPEGYTGSSAAADIKITPNGNFAYVSNRDTETRDRHQDSIAAFKIGSKGKLTRIGTFPTVWFPRSISIDGTGHQGITHRGLGSHRYRVMVRGPGGHSWGAFGLANPWHALGRAIRYFDEAGDSLTRSGPRTSYNVGRVGGGT